MRWRGIEDVNGGPVPIPHSAVIPSTVIPAKAGIQYPRAYLFNRNALEYWVARLRGR